MDNIIGLDELLKDFAQFGKDGLEKLKPHVDRAGDIVLNKAQEKAPVRSGDLRNSLYLKQQRASDKPIYQKTLTWKTKVRDYAAPVELGHSIKFQKDGKVYGHVPAQPFLRPAADESKEQVVKTIVNGIDRELQKLKKV